MGNVSDCRLTDILYFSWITRSFVSRGENATTWWCRLSQIGKNEMKIWHINSVSAFSPKNKAWGAWKYITWSHLDALHCNNCLDKRLFVLNRHLWRIFLSESLHHYLYQVKIENNFLNAVPLCIRRYYNIIILPLFSKKNISSTLALISSQHGENMKNRLFSVNVSRSFQSNPLNRPVKKVDSIPPEVR